MQNPNEMDPVPANALPQPEWVSSVMASRLRAEERLGLDRSCGEPVNLVSGFYCSHPVLPNDGWLGPVLYRPRNATAVLGRLLV